MDYPWYYVKFYPNKEKARTCLGIIGESVIEPLYRKAIDSPCHYGQFHPNMKNKMAAVDSLFIIAPLVCGVSCLVLDL